MWQLNRNGRKRETLTKCKRGSVTKMRLTVLAIQFYRAPGRLRRCGASVLCGFLPMYNTRVGLSIRTESRNLNRVNNFSYRSARRKNTGDSCDNCLTCLCIFHTAKLDPQNNSHIIIKLEMCVSMNENRGNREFFGDYN